MRENIRIGTLNHLNLKQRVSYFLLKMIEPHYIRLRNSLQAELNRIANLEAIAKGIELWKNYRRGKPAAGDPYDEYVHKKFRRQFESENCNHLKGGRRVRGIIKDYAVYGHTFFDGTRRIKCMLCPKSWRPEDPDWKEAVGMTEQSTNKWSSSEVPNTASIRENIQAERTKVVFQDSIPERKQ